MAGIENIRFLSGGRRLDAALKEANKVRESARSDVPIFVIVLTTGRQAIMPVSTPLDRAAQPLLASNASLIVVGIGSQPSDKELRSMVERDRDVFRLLPSQLQAQVPLLVVYMASQAGTRIIHHPTRAGAFVTAVTHYPLPPSPKIKGVPSSGYFLYFYIQSPRYLGFRLSLRLMTSDRRFFPDYRPSPLFAFHHSQIIPRLQQASPLIMSQSHLHCRARRQVGHFV